MEIENQQQVNISKSVPDLIQQASDFKQAGNQFFIEKNYKKALSNYHRVFLYLNGLQSEKDDYYKYAKNDKKVTLEQKLIIDDLKMTTHLNMSQIYIYQGKYDKGLQSANSALTIKYSIKVINQKNYSLKKGFFRAAQCNFHLDNLDEARKQFKQVAEQQQTLASECEGFQKKIQQRQKVLDEGLKNAMKKMWE